MTIAFAPAAAAALLLGAAAQAAPKVVADIAPIHSIAAAIMAGVAEPALIVRPGASEHDYALRPSEAAALADAEIVVWVGPSLTPWLADPLEALAPDALRVTLDAAPGVRLLNARAGGPFEPHAHDHGHGHGDEGHDHAHDDHGHEEDGHAHDHDHAHDDHAHDDHDHDHDHAHDGHDASTIDPHLWLDPENAVAIASILAETLGAADPANAPAYAVNSADFAARTAALGAEIEARLAPLRDRGFFVFHDAYQYFEDRFDLPAAGSIALSDAEAPRAPRIAEIRERLATEDIACVFSEPQFEPKLVATLIEGQEIRTGALDPVGAGLEPGPNLYPELLRGLADGLAACLGDAS